MKNFILCLSIIGFGCLLLGSNGWVLSPLLSHSSGLESFSGGRMHSSDVDEFCRSDCFGRRRVVFTLFSSAESEQQSDANDMLVKEIKAELEMRGVETSTFTDKESLVEALLEARSRGAGDPSVIDNLNKMKLEEAMDGVGSLGDEELEQAMGSVVGEGGTLPGGED
jgi:ABC-type phosphate/phosphonate transport system substrate-binding protein